MDGIQEKKRLEMTRRDLLKIAGTFGMMSTMMGLAGLSGVIGSADLARAANSTYQKRFKKQPKYTFKYGGTGLDARRLLIMRAGFLDFIQDLEERTDGEIRIEFIGNNQICNDLNCVSKTQQDIVQFFSAATQNSAGAAPYYNALDFAYMFPSRASVYHFLYHPKSEVLLREPLRRRHNVHFLFSHAELRGIFLGSKFRDKPDVKDIEELAGTKNRVTGTQLGLIAMKLLNLNPVPVAWEETLDGLKQGLLDGAEIWMSACAQVGMSPIVSQAVDLEFFCGTEHTAMNYAVFTKLPPHLQDAIMESAYYTQSYIKCAHEASLVNTVGATNPPRPGTIFAEAGTRYVTFTPEAKRRVEEKCSPEFNPKPWEEWRERINTWCGNGHDVYKEIHAIAREIPNDAKAENVEPRRWWKEIA